MSETVSLEPGSTALLVMDFQNGIVNGFAPDKEGLLERTAKLLAAARARDMLVIYVVVGFRPGFPEVSSRNKSFGAIRDSGRFGAGDPATEIHPAVARLPNEPVVTKHRVGAFSGTDLEMILRANGIDTLVLTGIATSGVVLSTVRHGADADYRLLVVQDCCSDPDAEVHRVLLEKVFPRQADIVSSEQVLDALNPQG